MTKGRVAIIYSQAALDSVPCLVNTVTLLAAAGYAVDVFTLVTPNFTRPEFDHPNINIHSTYIDTTPVAIASPDHPLHAALAKLGPLYRLIRSVFRALFRGKLKLKEGKLNRRRAKEMAAMHSEQSFTCVMAVDPEGTVDGWKMTELIDVPKAYFSLELMLSREIEADRDRRVKISEVKWTDRCDFVIIQDQERGRILAEENNLPADKIIYVPNAPLGPVRTERFRFWHEKFGLTGSIRIALHSGSLGDWTGLLDIVKSAGNWPENWVLVIHTRYDSRTMDEVDQLKMSAPPGKVFFSLEPVKREQYGRLVQSADVGIAFYIPQPGSTYTQENIRTIGLSSGKIAYFLRAGIPIIANRNVNLAGLPESHHCGLKVDDASKVGEALSAIGEEYDKFSKGAFRAFKERLDFEAAFEAALDRLSTR